MQKGQYIWKYQIFLTTWYQEVPHRDYIEPYRKDLYFDDMIAAAEYLGKNAEKIMSELPVCEINIKPVLYDTEIIH